ncbi:MAG TPA: hypothetical protein VFL58_15835, partial [Gaiellaceae bacterium]|nr:hypothetical protein [Gaiellaceae bacterium]
MIALRRREESVAELTSDQCAGLWWAIDRLTGAFTPDNFNCAFLQNQDRHVHLHVVPEYIAPPAEIAAIAAALGQSAVTPSRSPT